MVKTDGVSFVPRWAFGSKMPRRRSNFCKIFDIILQPILHTDKEASYSILHFP